MNIEEIKTHINEISHILLGKYDAIGISIGLKEQGGKLTDKIAAVFHVKSKKNIFELSPEKVIPRILTYSGIDIMTDVSESASFNSLSILEDEMEVNYNEITDPEIDTGLMFDLQPSNSETIILNQSTSENLKPAAVNYWNDFESPTIATHRSKHRPLKGGISSIYHRGSAATLGLIVSDASDGSTVLLSNNHVYAASQFAGTDTIGYGSYGNPLPLSTIQPSRGDGGDETSDIVGKFKRVVPLTMVSSNFVDAAISTIKGVDLENKVLHFNQNGPYEFATTAEIDSLLDINSSNFKAPVFRSGRTLGPIGYPGNAVVQTVTRHVNGYENLTDINNIANIESAVLQRGYPLTQRDTTIEPYGSNLIVKTTNKDYYVGGLINDTGGIETPGSNNTRKIVPNNLNTNFTGEGLIQVGNFDYFDIGVNMTLGISANEIVYYSNIENNNYLVIGDSAKVVGSLPVPMKKAQDSDFEKIHVPFDIDRSFDDKTTAFQISSNAPISSWLNTSFPRLTSMGDVSGDYVKVSDKMFIRKPVASENYNDMPFFSQAIDSTWIMNCPGNGNRLFLTSGIVDLSSFSASINISGGVWSYKVTGYNQGVVDDPNPIQDLSGIKKITNGYVNNVSLGSLWVLSGSDIYTLGSNGYHSMLGIDDFYRQHNLPTKIPGQWKDIVEFGTSTVLALSTSGDLFYATPTDLESNDIYRVLEKTSTTNSIDLTANNISETMFNGKKFKKIFSKNSYYWVYGIDENDDLYWLNIWYQSAYKISKNNSPADKWDADITTCYNTHGNSANHYFNEGNDMYFVNINGMSQRQLKDARDASQTTFLFDQVQDKAGVAGRTATKMSVNYLSGSGTAFGWRNSTGEFYSIDNFCGYDTTTNKWRVVGENLDNTFSDEEIFNDDIIVTDIGVNVSVNGFSSTAGSVIFKDCLAIRSKHGHFPVTAGGDSGSAVFAKFGNTWKVIGLVFAGPTPTNTARGIVCRIDRIQEQLNIKPWDGLACNDSVSTQILDFNTNKLSPVAITLSGRQFSSIGVESFF
jgi:hypothetical protein